MDIQRIPDIEKETFAKDFEKKLKERNWGAIYPGDNHKRYAYLNEGMSDRIWQYLQIHMP